MPSNVPSPRSSAIELPRTLRSNRSYPVQLGLRYKVVRDGQSIVNGHGRTRQLSSSELVFTTDQRLPIGAVEVALDWPFRLDGVCPLQVVVFGHVLHGSDQACTVRIERHEFRTRRLPPNSQSPDRPGSEISSMPA